MAASTDKSKRKLGMVSDDAAFVAMAKGAIAAGDAQEFVLFQKNIKDVGAEVREASFDALILDMDAGSAADFEQLQKLKRMVGPACAVVGAATANMSASRRHLGTRRSANVVGRGTTGCQDPPGRGQTQRTTGTQRHCTRAAAAASTRSPRPRGRNGQ